MPVSCDILNTGSELVLGRTLNRHGAWLGMRLSDIGVEVRRQLTLPDGDIIRHELERSVDEADLVLVTGGLGPTHDDMTRDFMAGLLGVEMPSDPETEAAIRRRLEARGKKMGPGQARQALVPRGGEVLANAQGTAPGLWFGPEPLRGRRAAGVALLPGPPRELHPMMIEQVLPRIEAAFAERLQRRTIRSFHFAGIGEGDLAARIDPLLAHLPHLEVGYCAHGDGTMELRVISEDPRELERVAELVTPAAEAHLFDQDGVGDLAAHVVGRLRAAGRTVATAESCTGGQVASRITDVPGASEVFREGVVAYADSVKRTFLGVPEEVLAEHGAVSEPVARAMAEGMLQKSGADHAVAVTGIAGPGGGSEEKPVGTVWVAVASQGSATTAQTARFPVGRKAFKTYVSTMALDQLRLALVPLH